MALAAAKLVKEGGEVDPVHLYGPYMKRKSEPVTEFNSVLKDLTHRMYRTMYHYVGIGLAAQQIGVFVRVAVINFENRKLVIVNPEIQDTRGECIEWERCLSIPGASRRRDNPARAKVTRSREVDLTYFDEEGKKHERTYKGYFARVVQHECDHLDGYFFIDRVSNLQKELVMSKYRKFVEHCKEQNA